MKLTRLMTTSTKGFSLDDTLNGRDLFVGPNGTGKSTRLESTMVGILGYVPGKKKLLENVFTMSSGPEMSISLKSDTDFECTRTIKEKSVKKRGTTEKTFSLTNSTSVFPPKGEKKDSDKKERIKDEFGDFAVMFNLNDFLEMSDDRKRAFVFDLTDPAQFGWDKTKVEEFISDGLNNNEDMLTTAMKIWDNSAPIQENVSRMVDWARENVSGIKAQLKTVISARETLLKQKQEIGSMPGAIQPVEDMIKESREKLRKTSSEIAAGKEKIKNSKSLRDRQNFLQLKSSQPLPPEIDLEKLTLLEKQLVEAERQGNEKVAARKKLEGLLEGIRKEYIKSSENVKDKTVDQRLIEQKLTTIKSSDNKCPLLDDVCPVADKLSGKITELTEELLDADKALRKAEEKLRVTKQDGERTQQDDQSYTKELQDLNRLTLKLTQEIGRIKQIKLESDTAKTQRTEYATQLEQITKELSELQVEDITLLQTAEAGLKERVSELETDIRKRREIQDLVKSFDKAKLEAIDLEEKLEEYEDLFITLGPSQLQGEILRDAISPLTRKINELLGKTSSDYNLTIDLLDKNGKKSFDMSWNKNDVLVPFEALSGGEKVIFSTALLSALVILKDPPLKVLCIEASEVDQGNLTMLLKAVNDFGEGIDNFLVATHVKPTEDVGWSMHEL